MDTFDMTQHARLVTLACPGVAAPFVVEQFTGREAINALFVFSVDVLATSADVDIDTMIGQAMTLSLLQPDGARRVWHGLCTHAGACGADGGLARYRLRLEPALAQLRLRRDSHLFQDQDAQAIVAELLRDYPQVRCTFDITGQLAQRGICTQYRETDFDFFCRLLASEGLNYRFDHDDDGYRLVIFDADASVPGSDVLRFHGVRATDVDDAIDRWHACRRIQASSVALSSWDPFEVFAPAAMLPSGLDAGQLPAMPIDDGSGERIASGPQAPGGEPTAHALRMLQALEQDNKVFEGAGAVRRLAAGQRFTLTRHEHYPDGANTFTVLWVEHAARNNIRAGVKGAATVVGDGTYRNTFACVRDTVALVPPATAAIHPRTAHGTQTALVVGLADAVATTNRDHQVRIQFAWQRGARPNPGGLAHPSVDGGNAPGDATCGAWVRVAEALAGPNWGSQFIPRIGTEVLVAFIEGDIDRPVIVGQLHNGVAPPPFAAGVDAAAGHDGTLSGIHTEAFDGNGFNQWQIDDTHGQLRMRLASSSAASELHLGHLVRQAYGSASRGEPRGSGFELRTDAWTVLRGAQGVLLSTSARPAAGSSVTSTQMDAQEAVTRFKGAVALNDALVQAAAQHHALASAPASTAQAGFIAAADPAAQGRYDGPVNGQAVSKARDASRELDETQPVERLHAPAVLLDAAAVLNWATPASTVVSAGQHLHWTTQSDLHMTAGAALSMTAGGSASLFTHARGIQVVAANGPVSLQAHTDALEIIADRDVVAVSVNDAVSIQASTRIVLQAGQSSVTLEGGDITFACPGTLTARAGQHVFDAGGSGQATLAKLPAKLVSMQAAQTAPRTADAFDEQIVYQDSHGAPVAGLPYKVASPADTALDLVDVSGADGTVERVATRTAAPLDYALRYATFKFT
jgi:type VI secretion system secreted protein VgrG